MWGIIYYVIGGIGIRDTKVTGERTMTILEQFKQAKEVWTNKKVIFEERPDGFKVNDVFHVALHATNGPHSRNIHLHLVPDSEDYGNTAIFLKKQDKAAIFYQFEATDRGLEITVWGNSEAAGDIDRHIEDFKDRMSKFLARLAGNKDKMGDVIRCITILERVDEVINNTLNNELNRVVYFSVGKVREFAANIPLLMNAPGFNLLQLSMNKQMSATNQLRTAAPEEKIPDDKAKSLLSDALKWKKYMLDFLNGNW